MWICSRSILSVGSPDHLHNNHSTHSVSSIERVVTSSNVVSTGKNTHSAHLEIPKVERLRMMEGAREGSKGERLEARRPSITPPCRTPESPLRGWSRLSIPDEIFQKRAVRQGAIQTAIEPCERNSLFQSLARSSRLDMRPNLKRTRTDAWDRVKVVKMPW